jgi:radical SAM protein with 4Fe4S-binding SPASM domain
LAQLRLYEVDCTYLPELSLEEFRQRIRKKPTPLGGTLEVTQRCNLRCVHCYCRLEASDQRALADELDIDTIRRIVDQAAEMGTLSLTLTGGEPLLRPDLLDIYDYIKSKGILPVLFTNGTLLTSRIAEHLAEYPPLFVEVSIYGMSRETYERITGVPGSHERCMRGIRELTDRGIKVFLKTPAMIQNRHELDSMAEFANSLGSDFRFDVLLNPRLEHMDDRYGPLDYGLPLQDRIDLEFADEARADAWESYTERLATLPRQDTSYICGAGLYGFFVDAKGHMSMCVVGRHPSYDLKEGTFGEGWALLRRTRQEVRDDPFSLECRACDIRAFCQQCPARAQLEHGPGAVSEKVEWLCTLAHLRAEKFFMTKGAKK